MRPTMWSAFPRHPARSRSRPGKRSAGRPPASIEPVTRPMYMGILQRRVEAPEPSARGPVPENKVGCERFLARAEGNRVLEAQVLVRVAGLQGMRGGFQRARDSTERAKSIFEDLDLLGEAARAVWSRGEVELLAGDPESAEEFLRLACDAFDQRGEKRRLSGAALTLAQALFALGRVEEALAYTQLAERVGTLDDIDLRARGLALRANMMARRGLFDQAESQARESVAIAEGTDFLNLRGDMLMDSAHVLRLAERSIEAAAAAGKALICYEQKGNVVAAGRARALLEELSSSTLI
jgi:tetratricopeptide (TPR) repeat protein